jgi:hypothetical protein
MFPRRSYAIVTERTPPQFFDALRYAAPLGWWKSTRLERDADNQLLVNTILDISGNGRDLTPFSNANRRAVYTADAGFGTPAMVTFDQSVYLLASWLPVQGTAPRCCVYVCGGYRNDSGSYSRFMGWSEAGSNHYWELLVNGVNNTSPYGLYWAAGTFIGFGVAPSLTIPDVVIYQFDGTNIISLVNGAQTTTALALNTGTTGNAFSIGQSTGGGLAANVDFYEAVVWGASFTVAQLQEMNAALQRQYKTGR